LRLLTRRPRSIEGSVAGQSGGRAHGTICRFLRRGRAPRGLTIRSSGPRRRPAVPSCGVWPRPLTSSVRPHRAFRFSARVSRRHGLASSPRLSFVHLLAGLRVGCSRGSRAKHLAQVQSVVALRLARGSLIPAQATTAWRCCYALVVALSFSPAAACVCGLTIRSTRP